MAESSEYHTIAFSDENILGTSLLGTLVIIPKYNIGGVCGIWLLDIFDELISQIIDLRFRSFD